MPFTLEDYNHAADVIRSRITVTPRIGIVLGSGLGALANEVEGASAIAYADIPGFPLSTVHGHAGELVVGMLEGQAVLVQRGRVHFYEGYDMQQVTFAIRVMRALGVETVILTNAAGGVNRAFSVGDIMMLVDHINLVGMSGQNPLMGANDDRLGPRFPGMAQTYDRHLRALALRVAEEHGITLQKGVYCALSGPFFETPAEIRMLRVIGADAVGMSTANEVLAARHGGMRVLAFSSITNVCIDEIDTNMDANHEEVLEAGKVIVPRLKMLIRGILRGYNGV
jgi:purine-nucleoside phosphorylase